MKDSTKKQIVGAMGIIGTVIGASATVSAIRTSGMSASSKLIAGTTGLVAAACAADKAMEVYLDGSEQKKLEEEAEKRLREKIENMSKTIDA